MLKTVNAKKLNRYFGTSVLLVSKKAGASVFSASSDLQSDDTEYLHL